MITTRAAKQRINRVLRPDLQSLRKSRADGRYYVIDYRKNYPAHHDVDVETFGQDLDVIAEWEAVEDDAA